MTPRSLQVVFRTLAAGLPATDAELLARHLAGDDEAFGELVRRHGRLVWSACRHLTRCEAEADDAFQATFLVLLKHARRVRDPAKLSAWLHAAAYRVCANARKALGRRAARERAAATPDGCGAAVPPSVWDRTLAAVHQEVVGLPETLRVPFVLCCLEGVGPTEAAQQLGWKLGTLTSRLTRAKDAVLARMDARGLAVGAVAGLGLASPPSTAVARAAALAHAGAIVPASLLTLSHGVVGMSVNPLKALAAAAMVAVGIGGGVGSSWVASATAQVPAAKARPDQEEKPRLLQAQLDDARERLAAQEKALAEARQKAVVYDKLAQERAEKDKRLSRDVVVNDSHAFWTPRYEYTLAMAPGLNAVRFQKLVVEHEVKGWEFAGTLPLDGTTACVFRKPVSRPVTAATGMNPLTWLTPGRPDDQVAKPKADPLSAPVADSFLTRIDPTAVQPGMAPPAPDKRPGGSVVKPDLAPPTPDSNPAAEDAAAIQAEIARLMTKLKTLQPAPAAPPLTVAFNKSSSEFDPETLGQMLRDLGHKRFGRGGKFNVSLSEGVVTVFGDQEVIDWANATVKKLKGN